MNVPAEALVNVTSEAVNPVTGSEKVNVIKIEELLVGPESRLDATVTVGNVLSKI